jgi:hypothetical protein
MVADKEMIAQVKQMAEDNYDSWGQYVVECYTDEEIVKDLANFDTLEEWVDIRIAVAEVIEERESY